MPIEAEGRTVVITIHPSAVLRLRDSSERTAAVSGLAADLMTAAGMAATADSACFRGCGGATRPGCGLDSTGGAVARKVLLVRPKG